MIGQHQIRQIFISPYLKELWQDIILRDGFLIKTEVYGGSLENKEQSQLRVS
jgi:hypothetical protein